MDDLATAIRTRVSCRDYEPRPLEPGDLAAVAGLLAGRHSGPWDNPVRLELMDFGGPGADAPAKLGTYGFVRGARHYIGGAVCRGQAGLNDFGYALELVILRLTALGLGTCWLGGTYDRGTVAARLQPSPAEVVPAVTPVGYPAARSTMVGRLVRLGARSATRKPWEELFFWDDAQMPPLSRADAGALGGALAAVRAAPSGANRQPWRLLVSRAGDTVHFYSRGRPWLDLGIALLHFAVAATELGPGGGWALDSQPQRQLAGLTYVATWKVGLREGSRL